MGLILNAKFSDVYPYLRIEHMRVAFGAELIFLLKHITNLFSVDADEKCIRRMRIQFIHHLKRLVRQPHF